MKTKKNFLKKLTAGILGFVMTLGVGAAGYAASASETRATNPTSPMQYDWDNGTSQPTDWATGGSTGAFASTRFALKGANGNTMNKAIWDAGTVFESITVSVYGVSNSTTDTTSKLGIYLVDSSGSTVNNLSSSQLTYKASASNAATVDSKTIGTSGQHVDYTFSGTNLTSQNTITGVKANLDVKNSNYVLRRIIISYVEKASDVTATYNANGGTCSESSKTVAAGTTITLPTPEYTGHNFEGWQINGSGTDYTGSYILNASTTFVAHWTPIRTLDHIELSSETSGYKINDSVTLPIITAYYTTGDPAELDPSKVSYELPSMTTSGQKSITFTYSEGGSGNKTATYNFTVYGIYSYSLNSASANPTAVIDQPWSFTGLKIDVVYKNNAGESAFDTETLTYGTDDFSVSSNDSTAVPGTKTISIDVTYKGVNKTINGVSATVIDIPTYERVTTAPTDWTGEYIIAYLTSATTALVFDGVDKPQDTVAADVKDNKIEFAGEMAKLTFAKIPNSTDYSIKVSTSATDQDTTSVTNFNNYYIGGVSGSNGYDKTNKANPIANTITFDDSDDVIELASNTSLFRYNADDTQDSKTGNYNNLRFRYYKTTTASGDKYHKPAIFKLCEPTVTLDSLTISGQTQAFELNDSFLFGGTVTANYSAGDPVDVTEDATFSIMKAAEGSVYTAIPDALDLSYDGATVKVSYTDDKNRSAETTYTISVKYADATSISITGGNPVEINVGQTFTVSATVSPSNANQAFTVSGGGTHTTLSGKTITGVSEGTDTFTVKSADEKASATLTVNVVASPSIVISPTTISGVYSGNNGTITVESYNTKGGTITYDWTVTDANPVGCVTVANATTSEGSNTVNYVAAGTAKVHVVGKENGVAFDNGDCSVTVTASTVTGLTITKGGEDAGATVAYKGESIILDASMTGVGNQGRVTWSLESGKEALASITPSLSDNKVTITSVSDDVILTCTSQLDSTKFDSVTLKVFNVEKFTASTATQFPLYKGANLINSLAIEEVTATFNDGSTLKKSTGQLKLLADSKEELNGSDEYYVALFTKGGTFNRRLYTTDTLTSEMDGMRLGIIYKYGETQKQTVKTYGLQVSEYLQPISQTTSKEETVTKTATLKMSDVPDSMLSNDGDERVNIDFGENNKVNLIGVEQESGTPPRFWDNKGTTELRTYKGNSMIFSVDDQTAVITSIVCSNFGSSITIPTGTTNSVTLSHSGDSRKDNTADIVVTYTVEELVPTTTYYTITGNAATTGELTYDAQYQAVKFAEAFNKLNTDSPEYDWTDAVSLFNTYKSKLATDAEKTSFEDIFKLAAQGTADSVQSCVKEYDIVVAKYGRTDFMGRGISPTLHAFAYSLNGGSLSGSGYTVADSYAYNTLITLPTSQQVSKAGCTFDGWYPQDGSTSGEWGVAYGSSFYLTGQTTVYAKWSANQYIVTFNGNDGGWSGVTTETVTETFGSNYILPTNNPTRDGYEFDGWWTTSDNTGSQVTTSTVVNVTDNNTVIYAHWSPKSYSITFTDSNIIDSGTGSCAVGATYTTTLSAKAGYLLPDELTATVNDQPFTGFTYNPSTGAFTIASMPIGNVIINGSAYQGAYTISYYDGETPIDEPQLIKSYNYGVGVPSLPDANDKKGYSFAGWYDNSDLTGSPVTSISASESGNKTFYAKWEFGAQDDLDSVLTQFGVAFKYTQDSTPIISGNSTTNKAETKAATDATGTSYTKITSTDDLTDGQYLIVYETGGVALNGALTSDVASNTVSVNILNGKISGNEEIDAAAVTISASDGSILGSGGKYIGHSGSSNTLNYASTAYDNEISFDDSGNVSFTIGSYTMKYNNTSGQYRFRYYKSGQQAIQLYKLDEVAELDHIVIEGTPSTTSYTVGQAYSTSGLHIEAYYDNNTHETVSGTITINKATAAFGDTSITYSATYGEKTATKEVGVTVSHSYSDVAFKLNIKTSGMDQFIEEYGDVFEDIGICVQYNGKTRYFSFIQADDGKYYMYEGDEQTAYKLTDGTFGLNLGDPINNRENASIEFTVRVYVKDASGEYYYSSEGKVVSLLTWLEEHNTSQYQTDQFKELYSIFFPEGN